MLSKIFIKNFALIDHLEVSLENGLQVITGETGAGKSIILGALRMILGERPDPKNTANTLEKCVAEIECTLPETWLTFFEENELEYEPQTHIRRELLPSGKSRAFVNDMPVTLELLKKLTSRLIDIHSQFETSQLFSPSYQFRIIDDMGENKNLLPEYQWSYTTYQEQKLQLKKLENTLQQNTNEQDYKQFLYAELESLSLETIQYDDMLASLSLQENAEMIAENLGALLGRFYQEEIGVLVAFQDASQKLSKITNAASHFAPLYSRFSENFVELKDILAEMENEAEKTEINPEQMKRLSELNDKLNLLFLKHNVTDVEGLITIKNKLEQEQKGNEEIEIEIENLKKEIEASEKKLADYANKLAVNRKKTIPLFVKKTEEILKKLGLEKAKLEVQLESKTTYDVFGKESIQILFQANTGFPMNPIESAISGGERSRVMLAIKKIMAENQDLPTLILDEIDTGVSGKVAEEIGILMKEMSSDMQLIVITHLAQVAAKGNQNYKVIKQEVNGKTQSTILPLDDQEKQLEIAQLLSGSKITDAAMAQAKELIG